MDVDIYNFLEHHGVKGQKWGVVNKSRLSGLKTKLSDVRQQHRDKRAQVNIDRAGAFQKHIDTISNRTTSNKFQERNKQIQLKALNDAKNNQLHDADLKKQGKLTPGEKKALIGAGVAAGVLATYGAYKVFGTQAGAAKLRSLHSQALYGDVFKRDESLAGKKSVEDILHDVSKPVNPNYSVTGGHMNCRRCTFAHELRRRGFDVEATPSSIGRGQNETGLVNALIKGDKNINTTKSMSTNVRQGLDVRTRAKGDNRIHQAFQETVPTKSLVEFPSGIKNALSKHPEGARGEIVFDEENFAHSMAWEIIDGQPHIFDSQKGQHFPVTEEGMRELRLKWGTPRSAAITRLDNVDLDTAFLGQWAVNTS